MKADNVGRGLFFIISGEVEIIQKVSRTRITTLKDEAIFGEISFFSGKPRTVTAQSKTFSELMYLNQHEFLKTIFQKHINA